jgi:hypothetical protein
MGERKVNQMVELASKGELKGGLEYCREATAAPPLSPNLTLVIAAQPWLVVVVVTERRRLAHGLDASFG